MAYSAGRANLARRRRVGGATTLKVRWGLSLGALLSLALSPAASAQGPRTGIEFQVNTVTGNAQARPALSSSALGSFVVVWESNLQDGAGWGIFAQRFSRTGAALGAELGVPERTGGHERRASVASSAVGDFVAVWHGGDGQGYGVFARRFTSAGTGLAIEFQVNTYTISYQMNASVSAETNGDFVVAWQSAGQDGSDRGVFARRFTSSGTALAVELQVNTVATGDQLYPRTAMDADGDFIVAWESLQDGSALGVFAQRFSSAGAALASEFQATTYTVGDQRSPSVTMDADGDFVVVWQSFNDDYAFNVFAQRFSSGGSQLAAEFRVNAFTPGPQTKPSVRAQANGDFVVAWDSQFQDTSNLGIVARRFSSAGIGLEAEFQVNTFFTADQTDQALAIDANGDFVVAWQSEHDGSYTGVFAQRFGPPDFDIDGNGANDPLTDGLIALRYMFGFRGTTLITGVIGAGCTRCDAAAIEAYLAGIAN